MSRLGLFTAAIRLAEWLPAPLLYRLARISGFLEVLPEDERGRAWAALGDVALRWTNTHRYRSEAELRTFLVGAGLFRMPGGAGRRGELVKANVEAVVWGATTLVTMGEQRWKTSVRG